jgi:hypothetical protein
MLAPSTVRAENSSIDGFSRLATRVRPIIPRMSSHHTAIFVFVIDDRYSRRAEFIIIVRLFDSALITPILIGCLSTLRFRSPKPLLSWVCMAEWHTKTAAVAGILLLPCTKAG